MPNVFVKNIFKEIRHSLGRFFSILCIVMIGVAFFAGVKASAPDMKYSADQYFDQYNVQDIQVYSTLGMTKDDIESIKKIQGVDKVQAVFSMDTLTQKESTQLVMQVISMPENQSMNQIRLISGRLPTKENECIIEADSAANELYGNFKMGDTITLTSGTDDALSDTLKNTEYTVVGTCYNPNYLSYEKGSSNIGNGEVDSFMYIQESNILVDYYTEVDVTVKGAKEVNCYSDEYFDIVDPVKERIESIADKQVKTRIQDQQDKVDEAKTKLNDEIADAQKQIDDGQSQINQAQQTISANEATLADSKATLDQGWKEYNDNVKVLDNLPTIENAISQIEQSEQQLPTLQSQLDQVNAGIGQIEPQEQTLLSTQDTLNTNIEELTNQISVLNEQISTLQSQLDQTTDPTEAARLSTEIDNLSQSLNVANTNLSNLQANLAQVQGTLNQLNTLRTQKSQLEDGINQINQASAQKQDLINQRDQLLQAQSQLNDAYAQLTQAQAQYDDGLAQINQAKQELASSQADLQASQQELNDKKAEALQEIQDAQEEIDKLNGEWIVLDRDSHYSYRDYEACADRMDGIAKVFPVFFFLVAALVCMTTMTRMVDEQRTEIGTLKALGYSKAQIASKYLIYALIASVIGSLLGCLIGMAMFPYVIFTAWNTLYNLESIHFAFQPGLMLASSASVTGITLLATLYSIYSELMEVPSQLMRPKAGKVGKKILLERIPWIWKRLSFLHKVTARNIFRYKKRFFMTVVGIAGCSALLVAGFGINDSISDIVHQQYEVIYHFNASVSVNSDSEDLKEEFLDQKGVQEVFKEEALPVTTKINNKDASVSIHIIDDTKNLNDFTSLQSTKDGKILKLKKGEAFISQKMADKLDKKLGDTIEVTDSDDYSFTVKIGGIYENYVGHHIYVSRETFESYKSTAQTSITYLLKTKSQSDSYEHSLGEKIMNFEDVQSVTFYSSLQENFSDMISSISMVVVVLVISAAALAFVVLYNLSNVNISERTREIATIKVLGFTSRETSQYVNRESLLLTVFGALVGLIVGIGLHNLIMNLAEMDDIMFGRTINTSSFIISFLLTVGFSIIINFVMKRKLKNIQMVESLKAVE